MRYYLIGYMYCGKTTLGRQLAERLNCPFVDLDLAFEERYHTTIPLFFQHYGEDAFRKLEQQMLHTTTQLESAIISTGGGTPCHFDNMQWMNKHGTTLFINADIETILERAAKSRKTRPILANKSPEERRHFVAQQLEQRLFFYQQAKLTLHNQNIEEVLSFLNEGNKLEE